MRKRIATHLCYMVTLFSCFTAFALAESLRPNIIVILVDDMGPGEPSYAGGIVDTPAIDRIASEGINFTDGHTTSAVCTPTRYGILTGRYNWRSRLKKGVLIGATSPALMDPKRLSLPSFLKNEGYHTGIIGKWHLGVDWVVHDKKGAEYKKILDQWSPEELKKSKNFFGSWLIDYTKPFENGPIDVGFDSAFFINGSLDMPPYVYLEGDNVSKRPTENKGWQHNEHNEFLRWGAAADDFEASEVLETFASKARQYIKIQAQDDKKPFFLYLPLTSPHTPVTPGKAFKGKYPQYSLYADFMAETDWVVEQVLEQLKASKVDENTMVIFTSDNGFAAYVPLPKMMAAGYAPSGPYRGAKTGLYEGGHRVPFLVRWPNVIKAGLTSDETVCTADFYATFADVLGKKDQIPADAAEDSFSFLSHLKGETGATRPFTIHHSGGGDFAIRRGDWKLIVTHRSGTGAFPRKTKTPAKVYQLYHMKDDVAETNNLENEHPELVESLLNDLAEAFRNGRTTPGEAQTNEGWPFLDKKIMKIFPQLQEK
jgi:arylsulfatase A